MKQVNQQYRSGSVKVDDVPPPSIRDVGLLVMNNASLISPGTERSTVGVICNLRPAITAKADNDEWPERPVATYEYC